MVKPRTGNGWGKSKINKICCYCDRHFPYSEITREHVIPKRLGGRVIRPCCYECNQQKGPMLLVDFVIMLLGDLIRLEKSLENYKEVKKIRRQIKNGIHLLKTLYPGEYDHI